MTGFGRGFFELGGQRFRIELRAVNSRFLDLKLRHPWHDAELDHGLSQRIRGALARGRVDLSVSEEGGGGAATALRLDSAVAGQLKTALEQLSEVLGGDAQLAARLLPPPRELLVAVPPPAEDVQRGLLEALDEALDALKEMRQREGAGLRADLEAHLADVQRLAEAIAARAKDEPLRARQRLEQRLKQLGLDENVDAARVTQEVALIAERCDVSEELARLAIHRDQLAEMLTSDEPVGRKLEFMLQEVNRELNTIASKTSDADAGTLVVEAKATLEKMREQVQNVE